MSWLFSRALVEEYWRADSSDGAQSALLSASPTPQAYLSPGKMTAYSSPSLSGMTFAPLTDALGEDLLMSFLADFPVRISARQGKNMGLRGERSGLWKEFVRVVREVRPEYVFVENSSALIVRGLDVVLGDLAGMGYDAEWCVLGANSVGAPQIRARVWIVASSGGNRLPGFYSPEGRETEAQREWMDITRVVGEIQQRKRDSIPQSWISRKNDGVAARVDRTKAIGNGQVPECAALAFQMMASRF